MRVWLAGSRAFGEAVFEAIRELPGCVVVAVSAPSQDTLAQAARDAGVRVLDGIPADVVAQVQTDVIVSAQNYQWIGPEARAAARYGAIGYHPSLLPRHRGRRGVEATIESGDRVGGGTVYQIDDGWDTGPIITQSACPVMSGWSPSDLWRKRLFDMGVRLLVRTIQEGGPWETWPQKECEATYAN